MDFKEIFYAECDKLGVVDVEFVKGQYGSANYAMQSVRCPEPKTLVSLATCLHELGHISLGEVKPVYYGEFLAEMFVRQKFKEYGLPLKRKIAKKQREYVAYRVGLSVKHSSRKDYKVNGVVCAFIGKTNKGLV